MIRYALACDQAHQFEAWFSTSDDYDSQVAAQLVECPFCASTAIRKQIMAPAVTGTKAQGERAQLVTMGEPGAGSGASPEVQAAMMELISRVRSYVETHFEDVGDRFAEEARDIHDGLADERAIYGQATGDEVRSLIEDGIPIAPLPISPRRTAKLN